LKNVLSFLARRSLLAALLLALSPALPGVAQATFPGRPGLVVFNLSTYQPGGAVSGGLYAIRPGEKQPHRLTSDPYDIDPSFAPSGQEIVFERTNTRQDGIYALDLAGGRIRRINAPESADEPAFGPNGSIVFRRRAEDDSLDLVLRTPNGRTRRLTKGTDTDSRPVFTPDGKRIVFIRSPRKTGSQRRLYPIRLDGSGLRALHTVPRDAYSFDISPNGRRLALGVYNQESEVRFTSDVWTIRLGGSGFDILSRGAFWPVYSPSGTKFIYTNYRGLWQRRADGHGEPTLIYEAEYLHGHDGSLVSYPAWQPLP
jgi:WD40-like Beta Propeller Repeat